MSTLVALLLAQGAADRVEAPDFALDVLPVLTRAGCNAGTCHGAAKGQNNFRLSLLGYDPASDHEALALEHRSRRVNRARPEESLMLLKATNKVSHGGGRVVKADSEAYRTLVAWVRAGAPRRTREAALERIAVKAPGRALERGEAVPLAVEARYSDGTARDVTALSLFSTNDEAVATVTPEGTVRAQGSGRTAVVVRFGGFVESVLVGSPVGAGAPAWASAHPVDDVLAGTWRDLRIVPAADASDAVFLRRAYLDVIGTLPSGEEARAFLGDESPDKRARLVDALLARPEFAPFWTLKFSEWLLPPDRARAAIDQDRPLTGFAREVLTGDRPFAPTEDPRGAMEYTIQTFHGFRMQCANCHNHPLERFSQDQYHALASFYARVRVEGGKVRIAPRGELTHPRTGKAVEPAFPDGTAAPAEDDRRWTLAAWLVGDPRFARAWANRLWGEVFGRGIVHPVDDMRASNPPLIPGLLEALSGEFAREPRLKPFLRLLLTSRAYGLSSKGAADERFFARAIVKPLPAEVLLDALVRAAGATGPRAIENYGEAGYTLQAFGRPPRTLLRPEFGGSLRQTLHLLNDKALNDLVEKMPETGVEELYWRALSRPPSAEERKRFSGLDPEGLRDLAWAVLASKEFTFRH